MPATYDEVVAAYHAQVEHTNLVRAEYQQRLAAETEECARLAEGHATHHRAGFPCEAAREIAAAIRQRASVASPTSALPRALPQDRDAAVGERDALLVAVHQIADFLRAELGYESIEKDGVLRCDWCSEPWDSDHKDTTGKRGTDCEIGAVLGFIRAALARLAPPQRAPAEPGDVTD